MDKLSRVGAAALIAAISAWVAPAAAQPVELRFMCYANAEECDVTRDLVRRFEAQNPDIRVALDVVGFNVVREQLALRLNAGAGPDIARVTNLGGLQRHYLDLRPLVDAAYWEQNFGQTLDWLRAGATDRGIYGFLGEFTMSGPVVNVGMFRRAGVPLPGPGATWDDWAAAARTVQTRLGVHAGIVFDRSGHRFASFALSQGAGLLGPDGAFVIDEPGFRTAARRFLDWHASGLMPRDLWLGATGARWRSGIDMFVNQDAVVHVSGSWAVQRYADAIGTRFEWTVVPPPCGPAACTGMPGGTAVVAFRGTRNPQAVGRLMDFLASGPILREYYERTLQLPAHRAIPRDGLTYPAGTPAAAVAALATFAEAAQTVSPVAMLLQAHPRNHILFDAIVTHLSEAIAGRISLDEAVRRIDVEVRQRP